MADCIFGMAGNDFVLIASDRGVTRSILKIQDCDDKLTELSTTQILGTCGEVSDRKSFSKLIKGEGEYYFYRYNIRLSTNEVANHTRSMLAENLRKGSLPVNCLIAGFDNNEPSLYWMDYLGTLQKVTRGAQGYCSYFLGGLMDNYYKKVRN
jgi:20S proteasome subunit beta 4